MPNPHNRPMPVKSTLGTPGPLVLVAEDTQYGLELITSFVDYPSEWDFRDPRFETHLRDAKRKIVEQLERENIQFDGGPFVMRRTDGTQVLIRKGFYVRGPSSVITDQDDGQIHYETVEHDGVISHRPVQQAKSRWFFTAVYRVPLVRAEKPDYPLAWRDHPNYKEPQ